MTPACVEARNLVKAYLRKKKLTPTEFSRRIACNQSTVQRFLEGRTKTITPAVSKMLRYAGIKEKDCIDATVRNAFDNAHIRHALERVWDGDEATAQTLASLIVAIAPLIALGRSSITN